MLRKKKTAFVKKQSHKEKEHAHNAIEPHETLERAVVRARVRRINWRDLFAQAALAFGVVREEPEGLHAISMPASRAMKERSVPKTAPSRWSRGPQLRR